MKYFSQKLIKNLFFLICLVVFCSCRPSVNLSRKGLPNSYDRTQTVSAVRSSSETPSQKIVLPSVNQEDQDISLPSVPNYQEVPKLPQVPTKQVASSGKATSVYKHLVVSGDTLSLLARNFNCSIEDIYRLNQELRTMGLKVGMVISVPYYKE